MPTPDAFGNKLAAAGRPLLASNTARLNAYLDLHEKRT